MTTSFVRKQDVNSGAVERKWWVVDADGQNLGRLCTRIAMVLRGKHKPVFTPNTDTGDFVIVVNASKVAVTGNKRAVKTYYEYSGYPGGLYGSTFADLAERDPARIFEHAVSGMLPKKSPLARQQLTKLKVYAGPEHPHAAQKPEPLPL